jgi:hypothetical protein
LDEARRLSDRKLSQYRTQISPRVPLLKLGLQAAEETHHISIFSRVAATTDAATTADPPFVATFKKSKLHRT